MQQLRFRRLFFALVSLTASTLLVTSPIAAWAAGNGKLQIHHIDVGQGDGILLVSPLGQTALFDDGTYTNCSGIKSYLQGLGITSVDYHFCTHYHSDHIGCIDDLAAIGITVATAGYDRGGSYSSSMYTAYVNTLGAKRRTIAKNQVVTLDAGAATPVTVKCIDLNGAGVYSGTDENSLSTVYKVTYGSFDEVLGGDLSSTVETAVGPEVGDVEVYKVHHHGSATSTNDSWLNAVTAEVGIISVGNGNSYGHPTSSALTRLHNHNVHTYWTETGAGVAPSPSWDKVGGTIVVQADPGTGAAYTVAGSGFTDTWYNGGGGGGGPLTDTRVASSVAMLQGTVTGGSVLNLAANDASRMTVSAVKSGTTYRTDWYGSATLAAQPSKLTITYDGNYSTSRTQLLFLYNFATSSWYQVDSYSVSTSDRTRTWTTTTPANYVSATNEVRLRVQANTRSSSYTCRGDYMAFTYEYTQGAAAPVFAVEAPALSIPSGDPGIALSAGPNPAFGSTRFVYTLDESADAVLDIFDLGGRRVAHAYSGRVPAGAGSIDWAITRDDGARLAAGVYFARFSTGTRSAVTRLVVLRR